MNKSMKKVLLGSTTLLAVGVAGHHVQAATGSVNIQAEIIAPVQITGTATLNFGSLTENGAGGTAAVDNLGALTPGGGVTAIGGTVTAGGFTLKGSSGVKVDVTAPASVQITETIGYTAKMTVGSFTIDAAPASAATPFQTTLGATSVTGFALGGTLTVNAGQAVGVYDGSVTLTANYN